MYNLNELGADVVRVNIVALPIFEELGVSPGMSESDWHVKSPGISYITVRKKGYEKAERYLPNPLTPKISRVILFTV